MNKYAVILAGGEARRFGRDKIFEPFQGRPLIEILIQNLKEAEFEIIISGPKEKLSSLDFPVIEDDLPLSGPLWALGSVFNKTNCQKLLLVAADMPFLNPALANQLWEEGGNFPITLLETNAPPSPLPGIYSREILPVIENLKTKKHHDLKALFQVLKPHFLPESTWHLLDPLEKAVWNINREEDLQNIS